MANVTKWLHPVFWQNEKCEKFWRFSDFSDSFTSQVWHFLREHNKTARLAFYSGMELGMLISDQFDHGKWGFALAYLILSAFLFFAVSYDHYRGRIATKTVQLRDRIATKTEQQFELQLGELEVSLSVLQLVDTLIQFIVTTWSRMFKFRFLGVFPLVFCLHTLIHHVFKDNLSKDPSPHEVNKELPSKEDHGDSPDKQSIRLSNSTRTKMTSDKNSRVSSAPASSSNVPNIVIIDDTKRTQINMSRLRRRFPRKGDEIGSNHMPSQKYDEAMPSTTTTEGDLNLVMGTTVDPPLHSDSVASTNPQAASIDVDMTGTTEAQTDLNDKSLLGRFPIKDDKISSDHWPPQKHDESSDDESMSGCASVGDHQVELLRKVIKEDGAGSSHSSPSEHDEASSSQQDPRNPPDNESMRGHTFPIKDDKISSDHWPPQKHDESSDDDSSDDESMSGCISVGNHQVELLRKVIKEDEAVSSHSSPNEHDDASPSQEDHGNPPKNESMPRHTSVKVDQAEITVTPVGHFPKPIELMSSIETEKSADEEMLREVKESQLDIKHKQPAVADEQSQPEIQATSCGDVENKMKVETADSFQGAEKQSRHNLMGKTRVVIRGSMEDDKSRKKALKIVSGHSGVQSVTITEVDTDRNQIEAIGDDIDVARLVISLRKKVGRFDIVSVHKIPEKESLSLGKIAPQLHGGYNSVKSNDPHPTSLQMMHEENPNACTVM